MHHEKLQLDELRACEHNHPILSPPLVSFRAIEAEDFSPLTEQDVAMQITSEHTTSWRSRCVPAWARWRCLTYASSVEMMIGREKTHLTDQLFLLLQVILPQSMSVKESHDIALLLQHKIESLEEVERCAHIMILQLVSRICDWPVLARLMCCIIQITLVYHRCRDVCDECSSD